MSDIARRLIKENLKTKHPTLDLGYCSLTNESVPQELRECTHLNTLILSNRWQQFTADNPKSKVVRSANREKENKLSRLPDELSSLTNLVHLYYGDLDGNNKVQALQPLAPLHKLQTLTLQSTSFRDLGLIQTFPQLKTLDLSNSNFQNLEYLKSLTTLESLVLRNTRVFDLSPIAHFERLKTLILTHTLLNKVDCIPNFSELRYLALQETPVKNLEVLAVNRNLVCLDLRNSNASDLRFISSLTQLEWLDLTGTRNVAYFPRSYAPSMTYLYLSKTNFRDPQPLADLSRLKELELSYTGVEDLTPIEGLTHLERLSLASTPLHQLDGLRSAPQLRSLDLANTSVQDISEISYLPRLQYLNVSRTKVSDISPLRHLTHLRFLYLNQTATKDIQPLEKLIGLNRLDLSNTKVNNLSSLHQMVHLQSLKLEHTYVSDVSPLERLIQLSELNLHNTFVRELSPLKALVKIRSLNLSKTIVQDLSPIANFDALEELKLTNTPVSDIESLEKLTELRELDLSQTKVKHVKALEHLKKLKKLNLAHTKVYEVESLKNHNRLVEIDLQQSNLIFVPSWLLMLPELRKICLIGTPITHLPYEIISQSNCYNDLHIWFKDLAAGQIQNDEIKIMVIGNGRVGKTCLIDRLTIGTYEKGKSSTHAIHLREHQAILVDSEGDELPLFVNYWDFGGQDIYHGTHRIFMQSRALFLLVWDWSGETEKYRTDDESEDGYLYKNHIIPHWLDYIRSFSKKSPVIIVQNKIDLDGVKNPPHQALIDNIYRIMGSYNVSSERNKRLQGLKEGINDVIEIMPEWQMRMPLAWHKARKKIRKLAQDVTDISMEEYEKICEQSEVRKPSYRALLDYLHNSGVLYYKVGMFHSRIILDQKWIISAIYTLFDRKKAFWIFLKNAGQFTFEQLHYIWEAEEGFSRAQSQLCLSFMISSEICYQLNEKEHMYQENFEPIFIAPQLLPIELQINRQIIAPQAGLFVQFRYDYLHQIFIQRFIVRAGHLANPEQVWRRGIWFVWNNTQAIINGEEENHSPKGYIQIQTRGPNERELLALVQKEFREIHPLGISFKAWTSLDGITWVLLDEITNGRKKQQNLIPAEDGKLVERKKYDLFAHSQKTKGAEQIGISDLRQHSSSSISQQKIKELKIRLGKMEIESVLDDLFFVAPNEVTMVRFKFNHLNKRIIEGVINESDSRLEWNLLIKSILGIMEQVEKGKLS